MIDNSYIIETTWGYMYLERLLIFSALITFGCRDATKSYVDSENTQEENTSDETGITDTPITPLDDSGETDHMDDTNDPEDTSDTEEPSVQPTYSCDDNSTYSPVPIGSWKVCIAHDLQVDDVLSTQTITRLTADLTHIETLLPASILLHLQEVFIWVERNQPTASGAVYHPSEGWLTQNGYPRYWARSVQIGNASNYLNWTAVQPAMVLHELSHAWHHQVLGYNNVEIQAAYDTAMSSGIYNSVAYAGGGMQTAYATTNAQEYFAELTEAYFWENDFYPFVASELSTFDPTGYNAVVNAWTTR